MSNFKIRKESSIINIRKFHNWVKRDLINTSCNYLISNYHFNTISLLDLAVGCGGDMNKWFDNNIMYVVGFDIDANSIKEAKKRYNNFMIELKKKNVQILPIYKFYVMDLADEKNIDKIKKIINNRKFHIVSCQFAIHYFFENVTILKNLINIVSLCIKKNGLFIGTTMNGNKIRDLFNMYGNVIQNDIFMIENNMDNNYSVILGKQSDTDHYFANGASIEYLVDINELIQTCIKFKLELAEIMEFDEWYMIFNNDLLNDMEKEFSFLNFSFVFKKIDF